MDLTAALDWARRRSDAILITIRRDGRPQSSDISYALDGDVFEISVTADRAKTANLRRDRRAVLHLTDRAAWAYVAFDGTAELSPVTERVGDATSDALVRYYERVAGRPHPDWDEYRQAMVDERRLLVRFTAVSAVGQIPS